MDTKETHRRFGILTAVGTLVVDGSTQQIALHTVAIRAMVIFLPLLLLVVGIAAIVYFTQIDAQLSVIRERELGTVKLQEKYIVGGIVSLSSDLQFLSRICELSWPVNSGETWASDHFAELGMHFLNFSTSKKIYDQIRLLNEHGMEVVRVNYNEGNPYIVSDEELHDKSKRYYFKDAYVLNRNQVFVSPLDLNVENGQIERPEKTKILSENSCFGKIWIKAKDDKYAKPMLRLGTPVFNQHDKKSGIVLLNYFGANLLSRLDEITGTRNSQSMLLNSDGYWLKGSNPENEWGFMYEDGKEMTFTKADPDAWQRIQSEQNGQFDTIQGLFTFTTVNPLLKGQMSSTGSGKAFAPSVKTLDIEEYNWKIVSYVPADMLHSAGNTLLAWLYLTTGLLTIFIAAGTLFLAWVYTARQQATVELLDTKNELFSCSFSLFCIFNIANNCRL